MMTHQHARRGAGEVIASPKIIQDNYVAMYNNYTFRHICTHAACENQTYNVHMKFHINWISK